ncbi:hypothetical protein ACHAL6_00705 [Proteiniclasticum sp. C24MP]|uniref:hypothetical protein n=1 Tax=Proteiniclasticum sp. C24MP TaxID=3374101 RepID=UPI003753EC60
MRDVKDYKSEILPIIQDMRSRGFSDHLILQTFQLVIEGIPARELKPLLSVKVNVNAGRDDVFLEGDPEYLLHVMASLMIAYRHKTDSTYGEGMADLILELEQLGKGPITVREAGTCQENTRC